MPTALATLLVTLFFAAPTFAQEWSPWHAIGPFDNPGGWHDVTIEHAPERALRELGPAGKGLDFTVREKGKGGAWIGWAKLVGEQAERTDLDVGTIDLNSALMPPAGVESWSENAAAYLYRTCVAAADATLGLELGSDDGLRVWWNGELVLERAVGRPVRVGDEILELPVRAGTNHLLVKVVNGNGGFGFAMAPGSRVAQSAIDTAIDKGVAHLLKHQLLDGSWAGFEGYGSGQTAYAVYTLVKCGLSWRHPAVQRGMAWVMARPSDFTYSTSCELLAACAIEKESLGAAGLRGWIEARRDVLLDMQETTGLWAYPVHPDGNHLPVDLSCTLYAALGLRAVRELDLAVPERAWRGLVDGALKCLEKTADKKFREDATPAAFGYHISGEGARGSTTTAGISVLAIAEKELGGVLSQQIRDRAAGARESGLAWILRHMVWSENPGGDHHYFWIYGIERVGALLGLRVIGGQDWYWIGAKYLVDHQLASGAWHGEESHVETILALLFLQRATMPTSGRKQDRLTKSWSADGPDAQMALIASGDTPFSVWIAGFPEPVRARYEWPGETGQGLHVERVEFLARSAEGDGDFELIGFEAGDGASPAGARRFAARHEFARNGKWLVKARAHVVPPPGDGGVPAPVAQLESMTLEVTIDEVLDPATITYAADGARNLFTDTRVRATASSHTGDQTAEKAVDGRASTRWHSAIDDKEPWLELVPARAVRADRVLLTHAWPRGTHPNAPRPMTVQLVVNDKQELTFQMDPDPLKKTVVELGAPERVRKLRLTILQSLDRTLGTDAVGFAEVELQEGG